MVGAGLPATDQRGEPRTGDVDIGAFREFWHLNRLGVLEAAGSRRVASGLSQLRIMSAVQCNSRIVELTTGRLRVSDQTPRASPPPLSLPAGSARSPSRFSHSPRWLLKPNK